MWNIPIMFIFPAVFMIMFGFFFFFVARKGFPFFGRRDNRSCWSFFRPGAHFFTQRLVVNLIDNGRIAYWEMENFLKSVR